jgi:hypothetical protein
MIAGCFSRKNRVIFDLHSHSTASDGVLSPRELVMRAAAQGVQVLALTDHDDTRGVAEAAAAAREHGIRIVPGVEISVSWSGRTVHIVGLVYIDTSDPELLEGLRVNRPGGWNAPGAWARNLPRSAYPAPTKAPTSAGGQQGT